MHMSVPYDYGASMLFVLAQLLFHVDTQFVAGTHLNFILQNV